MVNGAQVSAVFNPDRHEAAAFAQQFGLQPCDRYETMLDNVEAVYIASPHLTHYAYAKQALQAGKHVLCEIPFVLSGDEARDLYELAEAKNLVLLEANKTAYCPAFNHIVTLVKSGIVGDVVDVRASLSKMVNAPTRELDATQAGGAVNEHASITLMAIIKILGRDFSQAAFFSKKEGGVDVYSKVIVNFPHATSSITLGVGVKTEGDLVISGTKGYVYVPAPWWLTDFFEVRYEDQTKNKKYFYSYDGEGLRYEIQEFISMIVNSRRSCYKLRRRESIAIADIIGQYNQGINITWI